MDPNAFYVNADVREVDPATSVMPSMPSFRIRKCVIVESSTTSRVRPRRRLLGGLLYEFGRYAVESV